MTACPTCSAENADTARFCNQCGARLDGAAVTPARPSYTPRHLADRILKERSALRGEKKRVTVLFCDIKGSTRLAQQAGAEAWHGILDRFFGLLGSAVHRYEGTVNQYTGDGIMALFGAPIALEDHAQRACFAALEMQRELRRFADELRLSQGLNLTLRVGLNSGEVIVGAIGDDLRMDYTAQGHTVNLAARMEHICEPGRVYLSRDTARLVEGYFALRSLGRMQVDGIDDAVEVFDLEGTGTISTRLDRSLARGSSPFIGREAETATLLAALEKVRAGEGQVVAVVGEAGIGKSRLCHEFLQACGEGGFEVHRATGVPYAGALPLHPVRALALSRMGLAGRSKPDEIRRLVAGTLLLEHPEHAAALPAIFDFLGAGEASNAAPDQAVMTRAKLFELLAHFLPCPRDKPLVLLIEDLHFLDTASEEFLASLAQGVRGHRALLLLNHRPEYAADWLHGHLDAHIAVTALDAQQLGVLACTRLGGDASVAALAAEIGARAGGNPFFVEEAVQALADAGHLHGTPGAYRLQQAISQWPIPDTVHALLAARIDRLPAPRKALLQSAAIIGEAFAPTTLAVLAEREPLACAEDLRSLDAAGFLFGTPNGEVYDFRHPLMREVADGLQLESQRAHSHARMAATLEAAHPPDAHGGNAASTRIAHHWQQAGEWARAAEWNLHAARWAGTRDMRITNEQFRFALANLERAPRTPAVLRLCIAARAGLVRMAQFTPVPLADVERAYAEGRAFAAEIGDVAGEAELIISYGNEQLHRSNALGAVSLHAEAVALCMGHCQGVMVRRFRLGILLSHFSAGLPREGIALVDQADDGQWRREPIGEDNFISRAFHALMLAWLGELPEARRQLSAALAYATPDGRDASWMHAFMVDLAWFDDDRSEVLHHARLAMERAEESGSVYFQVIAGRAQAIALCMNQRPLEAIALLESLIPLTAAEGIAHQFEANHLAALAQAYEAAGQYEAARRTAEAAVASAQGSGSQVWEINAWLVLLALPETVIDSARAREGVARLGQLISSSGAAAYRPWWQRAEARWIAKTARVLDRA